MARIRTIKPEFWDDEKLARVSRDARLAFIGMLSNSDDYGVVRGHALWLKNSIFPYDDIPIETFTLWIKELSTIGIIFGFMSDGEKFFCIKNFKKHQLVDRPSKNRNPAPPEDLCESSTNDRRPIVESSANDRRIIAVGSGSGSGSGKGKGRVKGGVGGEPANPETSAHDASTVSPPSTQSVDTVSPPRLSSPDGDGFDVFWKTYPRKVGKIAAQKSWKKLKAPVTVLLPKILEAIEQQRASPQWTKDGGQYIPNPATWLNEGRWDDEIEKPETEMDRWKSEHGLS